MSLPPFLIGNYSELYNFSLKYHTSWKPYEYFLVMTSFVAQFTNGPEYFQVVYRN